MSKIESAMRAVLSLKEAFNQQNIPGMMEFMSEDCLVETSRPAPIGRAYQGREAVTQFWQNFFADSPRAHIKAEDLYGFGERCVLRWQFSPTGAQTDGKHLRGVSLFRVENDLICEMLSYVKG
jgi:ketosteroid isomerase-like protein